MSFNSYKEDEQLKENGKLKTLLRLLSYLLTYKKQIIAVLLIMLVSTVLTLITPLFYEYAIDDCIGTGDLPKLYRVMILTLIMSITVILGGRLRMYIMAKICNETLLTIRQQLYTHIQTLDLTFFDGRPTGKILARIMGDINSLKDVLNNFVTTLLPEFITVVAVAVIMFMRNPVLAAAALITLPFMAVCIWLIQVYSHKKWQDFRKKSSNLNAFIHEDMSGMRIIHSFPAEEETLNTFDELLNAHRDSFKKAVRLNDGMGSIIDLSWGLGFAAMYYIGIKILGIESVSVGTLVAFGTYIGMFWNPIMNLSNFYTQIITNLAAAERVFEIMDTESSISDSPEALPLPPIEGRVTFSHVDFSYEDDVKILDDVSFDIKPGETIALVGPTGAGKTTIVNLISRFYDIQNGHIRIDGHDIRQVTIESLRQQMGIMTQDNFLFTGTIRDNIRYGKLDATGEEIIAAAKAVHAHDFIMDLKDGYDTMLTERGGGLSVGQKQLLAFARTMVSNPNILILDEATSSIDTQTELLVQEGIDALLKGRTSFVIAHRLSTIQKADRIFVIDHGGIVEEGSASELLAKKGAYYRLHNAQLKFS